MSEVYFSFGDVKLTRACYSAHSLFDMSLSSNSGFAVFVDSLKFASATPIKRNSCVVPSSTRSRSESAILANSSPDAGGDGGVKLRVNVLNSLVFSLRTIVLAPR